MTPTDSSTLDRLLDIASGAESDDSFESENRGKLRRDWNEWAAFRLKSPDGSFAEVQMLKGQNLSVGGMCVVGRNLINVGTEGALLTVRSDGTPALIGVRVVFSKYVGEMRHETGMQFIDVPDGLSLESFEDQRGNLPNLKSGMAA